MILVKPVTAVIGICLLSARLHGVNYSALFLFRNFTSHPEHSYFIS